MVPPCTVSHVVYCPVRIWLFKYGFPLCTIPYVMYGLKLLPLVQTPSCPYGTPDYLQCTCFTLYNVHNCCSSLFDRTEYLLDRTKFSFQWLYENLLAMYGLSSSSCGCTTLCLRRRPYEFLVDVTVRPSISPSAVRCPPFPAVVQRPHHLCPYDVPLLL